MPQAKIICVCDDCIAKSPSGVPVTKREWHIHEMRQKNRNNLGDVVSANSSYLPHPNPSHISSTPADPAFVVGHRGFRIAAGVASNTLPSLSSTEPIDTLIAEISALDLEETADTLTEEMAALSINAEERKSERRAKKRAKNIHTRRAVANFKRLREACWEMTADLDDERLNTLEDLLDAEFKVETWTISAEATKRHEPSVDALRTEVNQLLDDLSDRLESLRGPDACSGAPVAYYSKSLYFTSFSSL